jgi:hypothetical protein
LPPSSPDEKVSGRRTERIFMIIDIHVHPFCREATLTPGIEEAVQRMFARHEPKRRESIQGIKVDPFVKTIK